ncbi:hypothetical protein ACIBEA_43180 [Streptomyces sp. NPDC051555]|uniref:hypothetical protein n=1 Tax=Streptomyces sp. NPDC051555 TaxID=3365657 RepID=UPI0037971FD9
MPADDPVACAMSELLPAGSSVWWRAAVVRAARWMPPMWRPVTVPTHHTHAFNRRRLAVLALAVLTVSYEEQQPADRVDIAVVRALVTADAGKETVGGVFTEPWTVRRRMEAAMLALREAGDATRPVLALFEQLSHIEYPDSMWSDDAPSPSDLASTVWWLSGELAALTDQEERQLPPAPAPAPALVVRVRGAIRNADHAPGPHGPVDPLACPSCGSHEGWKIYCDGMAASIVCPAGHISTPEVLTAPHVRTSIRLHPEEPLPDEAGTVDVATDIVVGGRRSAETADPYDYWRGRNWARLSGKARQHRQ